MSAAAIKARVAVGTEWELTNHYIARPDHPCYGTRRAAVTRATAGRVYLGDAGIDWPPAARIRIDDAGTVTLYGGGVNQAPGDLWITMRPAA